MKIVRVGQRVFIIMALLWILDFQANPGKLGERTPNLPVLSIAHAQTNVPSPRYAASMAFDSKRNKLVLFGGCLGDCSSGANKSNETWEYDGVTWTKINPTHSPPPRIWAGMVYDTQRAVIVLFGGYQLNDTWEYNGTDWTQITTQNSPSARTAVDLAYDSVRKVVILSSGHQPPYCNFGTIFTDVWEYNGANWIARINSGGPLNELPSIAYDPIRQKTIHFVGRHNCNLFSQTWAYDGTNISQLSPSISPPPTSGPIIFDAAKKRIALFGGCTDSNSSRCTQYSNDIWSFDGTTWSLLNATNKPPGRYFHSITYDTTRQRLVAFGGCADYYWGLRCNQALNDFWEFDGTNWKKISPQQSTLDCSDSQVYYGVQHCTEGAMEIFFIDPKDSHLSFETVLSQGYDRDGKFGECRDVNIPQYSSGPGCQVGGKYPGELVKHMAERYPDTVVAFNTDLFSHPQYNHGPEGLTIKKGERFDGLFNDRDENEVNRSSLSISFGGDVRIGIVDRNSLPNPSEPWTWHPDPVAYYNSVGGLPLLAHNGVRVDIAQQCLLEGGNCPDPNTPRGRTAVGKTTDGKLILTVIPESAGVTLQQLADKMVELGAVEAINLDGGGSSQLWYNGNYLVPSTRSVAEGLLIFSDPTVCPVEAALNPTGSNVDNHALRAQDFISLYSQLRDEVLSTTAVGQGYIEDYNQYGPEASIILLTDSDLRSRTAQFLEHAAPAFGSLLPNSNEEVVLTQTLYDEAEGLVYDLANAGSQELRDKMLQTWDDLSLNEHIGENATEIWEQIQQPTLFLPIIKKNY